MRITKTIFLLLFLCYSVPIFSQGTTPADSVAITQRLQEYGRLSMEWKVDSLLDYITPELYEIVPRATMAATFETMLDDDNMEIGFTDFSLQKIGQTVTHKKIAYCPVHYSLTMTMTMLSEDYREPDFLRIMAGSMGGEATIDSVNYVLTTRKDKLMFAIRHAPAKPWYFVEYQPNNTAMFDMIVPPTVREQLDLNK